MARYNGTILQFMLMRDQRAPINLFTQTRFSLSSFTSWKQHCYMDNKETRWEESGRKKNLPLGPQVPCERVSKSVWSADSKSHSGVLDDLDRFAWHSGLVTRDNQWPIPVFVLWWTSGWTGEKTTLNQTTTRTKDRAFATFPNTENRYTAD